jgi:YVTN family beta-propeller protein
MGNMFITNLGSGTVSVIDSATNKVVGTPIPVGLDPSGVTITPNGKYSYVADINATNVFVIDTTTNTVAATVAVGTSPHGVAITPNGKYSYVASGSNGPDTVVSVIDSATNTVAATV